MKRLFSITAMALLVGIGLVSMTAGATGPHKHPLFVRAWLSGYNEVANPPAPSTISSPGRGFFRAVVDEDAQTIQYWLTYSDVAIAQSHLHLGAHHTAGGVSVFLCTNLGNSAGTQACPAAPAQITGTITPANVIGPAGQGIAATEFGELVDAIRHHAVYVNIHSPTYPLGEIRGQLE